MKKVNKTDTISFDTFLSKLYGKVGTKRRIKNDQMLKEVELKQISKAEKN